jgi:hypothetical protein
MKKISETTSGGISAVSAGFGDQSEIHRSVYSGAPTKRNASGMMRRIATEDSTTMAKSVTYAEMLKKIKSGEWTASADVKPNKTITVTDTKTKKKFPVQVKADSKVTEKTSAKKTKVTEGVLDDIDDDGVMAKQQLYTLIKNAVRLHKTIQDTDNLEPWIQAKITSASEGIGAVAEFMDYSDVVDGTGPTVDNLDMELDAPEVSYEIKEGSGVLTADDVLDIAAAAGVLRTDRDSIGVDRPEYDWALSVADFYGDEVGAEGDIAASFEEYYNSPYYRGTEDDARSYQDDFAMDSMRDRDLIGEGITAMTARDIYKRMMRG